MKIVISCLFLLNSIFLYGQSISIEFCTKKDKSKLKAELNKKGLLSDEILNQMKIERDYCDLYTFIHCDGMSSYLFDRTENPRKNINASSIYKSIKHNKGRTISNLLDEDSYIPFDMMSSEDWHIFPTSSKELCGYKVIKAVHRQSDDIAWFAPEIPISDGPSKYSGLPGMILELFSVKNKSTISCQSVIRNDNDCTKDDLESVFSRTTEMEKDAIRKQFMSGRN